MTVPSSRSGLEVLIKLSLMVFQRLAAEPWKLKLKPVRLVCTLLILKLTASETSALKEFMLTSVMAYSRGLRACWKAV